MAAATCCAKFLLCLFNFLFFVVGTIVLGIGIWLVADKSSFISLLKAVEHEQIEQFTAPAVIDQMAYVLIVCGAIMFFLAFLGYCGAIRESTCLLYTYGFLLIIILVAQIAIASVAFAMKDRAKVEAKRFLINSIQEYYTPLKEMNAVTLVWNNAMVEMECCGVDSYRDFDRSHNWVAKRNTTIPPACCKFEDKRRLVLADAQCPNSPTDTNSYQNIGCFDAFFRQIESHLLWVIVGGVVLGLAQLILIGLAFCLISAIRRYRRMDVCA